MTFAVVGFSQGERDSTAFREEMPRAVAQSCGGVKDWEAFARRLSFVSGDATSAPHEAYATVTAGIERVESLFGIPGTVLFHMAVPAALFGTIAGRLGASGLCPQRGVSKRGA